MLAILIIVSIKLENPSPADSAALGNRLVAVIPGRVLISNKKNSSASLSLKSTRA